MYAKHFSNVYVAMLVTVLACGVVQAQTTFSTIRGTVTDKSGAVIPGVEVTVTEVTTNLSRTVESSGDGNFEAPDLKSGSYRLSAGLDGFKPKRSKLICSTSTPRSRRTRLWAHRVRR